MADGFGRVPIQAEMATGNRQIGGNGKFLTGTRTDQGTIVPDAQTQAAFGGLNGAAADLAKQGQFAKGCSAAGSTLFARHILKE
jgi:hypothetical protein